MGLVGYLLKMTFSLRKGGGHKGLLGGGGGGGGGGVGF